MNRSTFFFRLIAVLTTCLLISGIVSAQSWQAQNSGTTNDLRHVHFVNATTGWVVGHSGTVLKTTNGGTTWTKQPFAASYGNLIGCYFVNETTGWVGGDVGVYKTTDGGSTWTMQSGPSDVTKFFFLDANTGWAVGGADGSSKYGSIYKTTDGGASWALTSDNTSWVRFYGIQFVDATHGWAYAEVNGLLVGTTDGGAHWTTLQNNSSNLIRGFYFKDANTGWFCGRSNTSGLSMKTTDGGTNWLNLAGQLNYQLSSITMVNDQVGWVTSGPTVLKTTNGGASWSVDYQGLTGFGSSSICFADANHGWAVGEGGLIVAYTGNLNQLTNPSAEEQALKVYPSSDGGLTNITYTIISAGTVELSIWDLSGRKVASLVNAPRPKGSYTINYDMHSHAAGVYLVRLQCNHSIETVRILNQ